LEGDHNNFLKKNIKLKTGPIVILERSANEATRLARLDSARLAEAPTKRVESHSTSKKRKDSISLRQSADPSRMTANKIIGTHQGLPLYTIGQRKGIELGGTGPYYVVKTDYKTNTLYVTNEVNHKALFSNQLNCKNINWIGGKTPKMPFNCSAKIRYGHKANKCTINQTKDKLSVKFEKAQRAITPGQSVVFYKKDELLGGGIII